MPFKMGALQRVTESSVSTERKTLQMSEFEADTKENSMCLKEGIGKSKGNKGVPGSNFQAERPLYANVH